MRRLIRIRSKSALVVLAVVLVSTIGGRTAELDVPASYPTIQAAVDAAASGDTILIGAGVYTNQVVITNKNLTLAGSPGAVLRATPNMQRSLLSATGDYDVALLGVFNSEVLVSGLTFEGDHLADTQPNKFVGITFLAASGRVEGCRIMGFRGEAIDNTNGGWGVTIVNPHGFGVDRVNLDILRNTFADNAISISLQGDMRTKLDPNWNPETLATTFAVDDNNIVGNGSNTLGAQFGISISVGAGGEVKRNTITDYSYTGQFSYYNLTYYAFGIIGDDTVDWGSTNALQSLQPVYFEGNIFRNNQIDMALLHADGCTIVNNSFEGTAPGQRPTGLGFSGDNVLVATNRFSDMPQGVVLFGDDDYQWVDSLGITSNAMLTANSFCNVTTPYFFEGMTTFTEQGTSTNCPEPNLDVTRAVLLTWPYNVQGYSVESAPTMDGPWTTNSGAAVFLQNGENNAAIPADSDEQIFRLVKQP